jgi:hypothetical protein
MPADIQDAGTRTWVVEASRDGVRVDDLAVSVLNEIGHAAVQHAGCAHRQGGCVLVGVDTKASGLHSCVTDNRCQNDDGDGDDVSTPKPVASTPALHTTIIRIFRVPGNPWSGCVLVGVDTKASGLHSCRTHISERQIDNRCQHDYRTTAN